MTSVDRALQCAVCSSDGLIPFFELEQVPLFCNILWESSEAAVNCGRGDIKLTCCPNCGFIGNSAFDPSKLDYDADYENSLHFSPRFQQYANSLARRLVNDFLLQTKNVIEIGCGKGDFLSMLVNSGAAHGTGFDRSYVERPVHIQKDNLSFVSEFYSEQYADLPVDLIACRHVLEHMEQPVAFLKQIREIIGDRVATDVFFEVPNGLHTFEQMAIWDIIYEHPNYFCPSSLASGFELSGYQAVKIQTEFDNQFLSIVAKPSDDNHESRIADRSEDVQRLLRIVREFSGKFDRMRSNWSAKLDTMRQENKKAVVWGSGSKGITFLNIMNASDVIKYAIDINPRKNGKFVAGAGQKIVAPDELTNHCPDTVIIMNPLYESEIRKTVLELGLAPDILVV